MDMLLKKLVDTKHQEEFWRALISPRNGNEWLTPRDVGGILREWSDEEELPKDVRTVATKVLCGPEWRISIDEFIGEVNNIIARLH